MAVYNLFPIQQVCNPQIRFMSQGLMPVISVPLHLEQRLKVNALKEKKRQRAILRQESRRGNQNIPLITCKNKELNHYYGQVYGKFEQVPLASKGWKHKKAAGDYFTINGSSGNPAFENCEEDFSSLGLDEDLTNQLHNMGFKRPTNIQTLAIPHILEGKNTLITAETGNGKTLAFLAPMLQQIAKRKKTEAISLYNSPIGLIITPGKELAAQIHGVASEIGKSLGIKVKLLTGGKTKKRMLSPPMSQDDLLVASFGALSKLTTVGIYNMKFLTHITLDEADTLLDDSFNDSVKRFINKCQIQNVDENQEVIPLSGAQLTMVAATAPRGLNRILDTVVNFDSLVPVATSQLNRPMVHVPQRFFRVNRNTKVEKMLEIIQKDVKKGSPLIIFSNDSKTCDWISLFLNESGVSCTNLNGKMPMQLRQKYYSAFMEGQYKVLSSTDLVSRGLDTPQVPHVINYSFPSYIADYIHRCGRTGRVGSSSSSRVSSLVHKPWEVELVQKIEYAVRTGQEFHNVNANIKRILTTAAQKRSQ